VLLDSESRMNGLMVIRVGGVLLRRLRASLLVKDSFGDVYGDWEMLWREG